MSSIHSILKHYWGYDQFRPLQEEIIQAVLKGEDTLALLPTGGGKSICFQVPAIAKEGICIVVSPLIALMKDQVENLQKKGIKALSLTSGMGKREIDIALDNAVYGDYKFLYLSPERLLSDLVRERIKKMKVNLLAIDEAHCISQWGYDFRPAYLQIASLRELIPDVPVLALTATATERVQLDIQQQLQFKKEHLLKKSFERKNLSYVVFHQENKLQKLQEIATNVQGSGVVYVRNRRETQEVAAWLYKEGISADFYHAGVAMGIRSQKQEAWIANKTRIMVATNAFGMGIDKPDVRFVVHLDLPESLEAYYQEAGRAGRDEQKAYGVLLYNESDRLQLKERYKMAFPTVEEIKTVYQSLCNHLQLAIGAAEGQSFDFDIAAFCQKYKLPVVTVFNAFKFLEHDAYLSISEEVYAPARLLMIVNKKQLASFMQQHADYEALIKVILRSYGGVFDQYAKINETELAQRNDSNTALVKQQLLKLHEFGIIDYQAQKDQPQITFLQARVDAKAMRIDTQYLANRKRIYEEKMEATLNYASSDKTCRSMLLLQYFGEQHAEPCGVCDVCLALNKIEPNLKELQSILSQAKQLLISPIPLTQFIQQLKGMPEKKKLKAVQLLVDEGTLVQQEELIALP